MTSPSKTRKFSARRRLRPGSSRSARDAKALWERALDVWEDFEERGLDYHRDVVHGPALLDALGPVRGLRVLDLGCGQGRFTRQIAQRGARVLALDWSRAMVSAARRHERERPLGIDYRCLDARSALRIGPRGTFDRVVSCMALDNMPDLSRVLRAAHALLRPGGRLVFSVSHPLNSAAQGWEHPSLSDRGAMLVDRYFEEGVRLTEWRMARLKRPFDTLYWHRTFETWFAQLHRAGFRVDSLTEPHATAAQARRLPALRGTRRVPFFLVIGARRVSPNDG